MVQFFIYLLLIVQTSLYSLHFKSVDGSTVSYSAYQGKKILLVNIASGSEKAAQLADLQQLYTLYQNNLVVIAFPTNSFGNEPLSDQAIQQLCQSQYGVSFPIAAKSVLTGSEAQPVYKWIASKSENGMMDGVVVNDFQKFLINEEGKLIGVFAPSINPMDSTLQDAITGQ